MCVSQIAWKRKYSVILWTSLSLALLLITCCCRAYCYAGPYLLTVNAFASAYLPIHTNIFNIIYTKLMRCFIATHSYYFCCYYFYVYYVRLFKLPAFVVAHFLFDKLPNFYDCKYRSQRQHALTHFIKVIAKFRNFVNGSCQALLFLSIFLLLLFMFFQAYLECSSFAFVALSAIYHICILPHCCCRVTTMYCWSFVATAVSPSTKNVGEIYSFFNSSLSKPFVHNLYFLCYFFCTALSSCA